MSEWTQGPWEAVRRSVIDTKGETLFIANLAMPLRQAVANTRLIASAPTTHAAALRVVSAHRAYPEDLPAAIDELWRVLCEADPQLAADAKD